jgi:hypothetical protein
MLFPYNGGSPAPSTDFFNGLLQGEFIIFLPLFRITQQLSGVRFMTTDPLLCIGIILAHISGKEKQ